jgi:hypothetical protein
MVEQDMSYCEEITAAMAKGRALETRIRNGEKHLHGELDRLGRLRNELQQRAAIDFAKLNGWKYSKASFAPSMLARGSTQRKMREAWDEGWVHELFDHPVYFRETRSPYRPVAIVGQPYKTDVISARVTAMQIGLDLHVPPKRTASWWLPGSTAFFCFTRPEQIVRFLPDQCL